MKKQGEILEETYGSLHQLIQVLTEHTKAHICIHDVSGILKYHALNLDFRWQVHSKDFCNTAKITPRGYRLCLDCKMRANQKAISEKTAFCGYCSYGIFEVVKPVVIDERVQCIIYIGNLIYDFEEASKKIQHTCAITKVPEKELQSCLKETQLILSEDYYLQTANLIDSYIRLLYEHYKINNHEEEQLHWAVLTLQNYINTNYNQNISLQNVSKLYFINNKYIGRLFKKQIGYTFHEYLNRVRLENATNLLLHTSNNIIDIAMDSGFQNVTYFNRLFFQKYQMSPVKFRLLH